MKFMNILKNVEKKKANFPPETCVDTYSTVYENTCPTTPLLTFVLLSVHIVWKNGWFPKDNLSQRKELGSSFQMQKGKIKQNNKQQNS